MQINITFKPTAIYSARTKEEVLRKIRIGRHGLCETFGGYGNYLSPANPDTRWDGDLIRVYTMEKRRKVVQVLDKPKKWTKTELKKAGFLPTDEKITTRVVVKKAEWIAHVYDIPLTVVKAAKLKVVQGARTFKLVPISNRT